MTFRKADGRRDVSRQSILLHKPWAVVVPPLGTIKDIIKTGRGGFSCKVGRTAESLGEKKHIPMIHSYLVDKPFPKAPRHLVCRITPESPKPECYQIFHHLQAIVVEPFLIACFPMIEFC